MTLEQRFSSGYYDWAKSDFRQELVRGLPVLSKLRSSYSLPISAFLSTLPTDQQWTFALGLLKRGIHAEGARLCGESLSYAEKDLLTKYKNRAITKNSIFAFPQIHLSQSEAEITTAIEAGTLVLQKPTKVFQNAVWKRVSKSLGVPQKVERQGSNAVIVLNSSIEHWTVWTHISFSIKVPLRYTHILTSSMLPKFTQHLSFLAWLGIAGDTAWDILTTDAADDAIETLIELCQRFLRTAPEWLPK